MPNINTKITKRSRFSQAVNRIPLIGGLNMELRPHVELVFRKEETIGRPLPFATRFYKTGGVKIFMGAVKCTKSIVDGNGNVAFRKGERLLSPHIIGSTKKSIVEAIEKTFKFVQANRKELEEAGISGLVLEPGSETYSNRVKKMGGIEVEASRLHKMFAPYVLKFMGKFFPSNMPPIKNISMKRIVIRLDRI